MQTEGLVGSPNPTGMGLQDGGPQSRVGVAELLEQRAGTGRLRSAPDRRGEADRPGQRAPRPARGLPGAQAGRDPGDDLLDPHPAAARAAGGRAGAGLRPRPAGQGPVPAQRLLPARLGGGRLPADPPGDQAAGGPRHPRPGEQPGPPAPGVRARHRAHRVGQVDHPGQHGRPGQPGARGPHHDRGGPDRVPPHPQALPGQPARGRRGHQVVRQRPQARRCARTPTSSWSGSCATWRRSRSP